MYELYSVTEKKTAGQVLKGQVSEWFWDSKKHNDYTVSTGGLYGDKPLAIILN